MRAEDRIRVRHMLDAIESVRRSTERRQSKDLDTDEMLLFAVIRAIEILGEAAGKVSEDVRFRSSSIPWSAIVAMRNRLIHGYFDIDTEVVWNTVSMELPQIEPAFRALLSEAL